MEEEVVAMEYLLDQVTQKDVGKRLQVGQEVIELILDQEKTPDLEQDQSVVDRMVDAVASSWVNSSNFKVTFEPDFQPECGAVVDADAVSAVVLQLFAGEHTIINTPWKIQLVFQDIPNISHQRQ